MNRFTHRTGTPIYVIEEGESIDVHAIPEDYAFVVSKDGFFSKKKNVLYEGITKLDKCTFLGEVKEEVYSLFDLKVPLALFYSIENFFQHIYNKMQTEVQCFLYYRFDTNKWAYAVPTQTVTPAHVSYDEALGASYMLEDNLDKYVTELPDKENWTKIGTIHSHASMPAFHSGTDDKDEFGFDGIHITIGNFNQPVHSYSARLMLGKVAIKKEIYEVVDSPMMAGRFPKELEDLVTKETCIAPATVGATSQTTYSPHWQTQAKDVYSGGVSVWRYEGPTQKTTYTGSNVLNNWNKKDYAFKDGIVMTQEEVY